jgi:hypothetical protein
LAKKRKAKGWKHTLFIFILTFIVATVVGGISIQVLNYTQLWVAVLILLLVILLHVGFDVIGTAAMAATEPPHHARAAKKIMGAKQAIRLVKNADVVATFSNDIIGDVTSTIGGAMATTIILVFIRQYPFMSAYEFWLNTLILALVASLMVASKAFSKTIAMQQANEIIGWVGKLMVVVEGLFPWRNREKKERKN